MLYFIFYRFSMNSKSGLVYMWISFEMVINIIMTILYGYVYLSIFTAFLLAISEDPSAFILCMVYILGLQLFLPELAFCGASPILSQLPFVVLTILAVVLLPLTIYSKNKRENLEGSWKRPMNGLLS